MRAARSACTAFSETPATRHRVSIRRGFPLFVENGIFSQQFGLGQFVHLAAGHLAAATSQASGRIDEDRKGVARGAT
jgi:hypothetical protein